MIVLARHTEIRRARNWHAKELDRHKVEWDKFEVELKQTLRTIKKRPLRYQRVSI